MIRRHVVSADDSRPTVPAQLGIGVAPPYPPSYPPPCPPTAPLTNPPVSKPTTLATDLKRLANRREAVSPAVLENYLMRHPAVAEASVVAVPHGTSGKRPMAVVVVRAGKHVTFDELRDLLAGKVAAWQIPDWWALIPERPKSSADAANDKVLRRWYADGWRGLDAPKMYR